MKQTIRTRRIKPPRAVRIIPALLWMALIYWLSSRTGEQLDTVMPWLQKLLPFMTSFDWGHFAAYFILALLFDYAIGRAGDHWGMKAIIVALCLLYGITDEYHQSFTEGRMPDLADLRNDTIGAALAVLAIRIPAIRRRWRKFTG
ncbi:VanZ family protein [Paenibacillus tarimensis]